MGFLAHPRRILAALTLLCACSPTFAGPFAGKIGVELDGVGGRSMEFVDAAKTARSYASIDGSELAKDEHGWPLADAYTVVFDHRPTFAWAPPADDPEGRQPDVSGAYKLSFTGRARLTPREDPNAFTIANQKYDPATNTTTADLTLPKGHNLFIIEFHDTQRAPDSKTNTGFCNVRIIRPGYAPGTKQVFTNGFLRALKPFAVLRYMDWISTNSQAPNWGYYPKSFDWSARKRRDDATQCEDIDRRGIAWEYVVELANTTGKDLWINVPDVASDEYVTKLASMMKALLKPGLRIYIEHSNEVWNWGFMQSVYNRMAADAEVAAGGSNLADDGKTDTDTIRARRHARRTIEIGKIFRAAFGESGANGRVRPVLSWWTIFPDQYEGMLSWIRRNYGPPKSLLYGIASTGYFNAVSAPKDASPEAILDAMSKDADNSLNFWRSINRIAGAYGLKSVVYEGGPDTGGGDPTNVGNRIRAERSPRMAEIVTHQIRDNWFGHGGDLFMYFSLCGAYSRYGCWGALEDVTKLDTPKYKALTRLTR